MKNLINSYIVGDNLEVIKYIPDNTIDLVYIDPPYATGRDFGDFLDKFDTITDFVEGFMEPIIQGLYRKLKSTGTIAVHIDITSSHYMKVMMDGVFGIKMFRNEIVWITNGNTKTKNKLYKSHDTILIYTKSNKHTFNPIYIPYGEEYRKANSVYIDGRGEYVTCPIHNSQPEVVKRPNLRYEFRGISKQWLVSKEKLNDLYKDDRLTFSKAGIPRIKRYLSEMSGVPINDVWKDIPSIQSGEKLDYATQKPVKLLHRIVSLYSNKDDLVVDCFAGSGATGRACIDIDRNYILIDKNAKGKDIFEKSLTKTKIKESLNKDIYDNSFF